MKLKEALVAFNRGLVSALAIARVDIKRLALSAEVMTNWMPRSLGSMMLRPGLGHLGATKSNNLARMLPFVRSLTDKALIELTGGLMRVWIDDELIDRDSVASTVNNPDFTSNLSGWTDNDEAGAASVWVTGGFAGLTGTGTNAAILDQAITVAGADQNVEHAIDIIVTRGPLTLRVGSTTGGDDYITETALGTGSHSLALTPTGNFSIRLMNRLGRQILVSSVQVAPSGVMELITQWDANDLPNIRGGIESQSADVLFVACEGVRQQRIERRGARSWSVVDYYANDGPFRAENLTRTTITPSAITGNITLTASTSIFKPTHVGALFRGTSVGQIVSVSVTAENQFSSAIRVTGVGAARGFGFAIFGTWVATVVLQASVGAEGNWQDVASYSANVQDGFNDNLDNQVIYYRIGVKTGGYTSGTAICNLQYASGQIDGFARVTAFTSATVVSAEVLKDFGGTAATSIWAEGAWSDFRGWPTAVALYEGRLVWAGKDKAWCSVSDAFESFDENYEGDAGPINRSIGSGPIERINWVLPLGRLMLGGEMAEFSCRSTAFDEPITPTNFNIKAPSTQGSGPIEALKIDSRGVFVQRSGLRAYELAMDGESYDYKSTDLALLVPEIGSPGFVRMAVQRQPDTRIHFLRSDGTVAVLILDRAENVLCWCEIETDGEIEDAVVLPAASGEAEDSVYYVVARQIEGATVRYLEKWALESEAVGGNVNKQGDSFVVVTNNPASTTVAGLDHLEDETVVVWADGADVGTDANGDQLYTVVDGELLTVGLSYLDLPGSVGNYASTPDSAAVSITGDIDIRVNVQCNSWATGVLQRLVSKHSGSLSSQNSYRFAVNPSGFLSLKWSVTGTEATSVEVLSSLVVPVADGARIWVRATLDVDNGSGSYVVTFYTSATGDTWTQLGTSTLGGGTTSIFNGTLSYLIGGAGTLVGGGVFGRIYEAELFNGIAGTLAAEFDALDGTTGATSFVSVDTGETYTINQSGSPRAELVVQSELATAASRVMVGLPYEAPYKSAKVSRALGARGRVDHLGLILRDVHVGGLRFGPSLEDDEMDPLPLVRNGAAIDATEVVESIDEEPIEFPGTWNTDSRLCLKAAAPRPVTVLAAIVDGEVYD